MFPSSKSGGAAQASCAVRFYISLMSPYVPTTVPRQRRARKAAALLCNGTRTLPVRKAEAAVRPECTQARWPALFGSPPPFSKEDPGPSEET